MLSTFRVISTLYGDCKRDDGVTGRRLFIVEKRDRATPLPIIQHEVEVAGSTIHSNE